MNDLKHKIVLLQDGAADIIVNDIREVKEETNLEVLKNDLKLIDIISGKSRKNEYHKVM